MVPGADYGSHRVLFVQEKKRMFDLILRGGRIPRSKRGTQEKKGLAFGLGENASSAQKEE